MKKERKRGMKKNREKERRKKGMKREKEWRKKAGPPIDRHPAIPPAAAVA